MDYINNYWNYYFYGQETIILKPSNKYLNGNSLISILQKDGNDYYLPIDYSIIKIEYMPSVNYQNPEYEFIIEFDNNNVINIDNEHQVQICNIKYNKEQCFMIKFNSLNFPKLPISKMSDFSIILTIAKNNNNYNYISLNTQLYTSTNYLPNIEKILFADRKDIGLCFSGGGPRSFSATLGYIRALHKLNVLKDVKYVSTVSGATWTWIPYTFLNSDANEEKFIGYDIFGDLDKKLTMKDINYTDEKYLGNSLISKAYNFQLFKYVYDALINLDCGEKSRIWAYMLGKILLEPYGLLDTNFFAPNQKIADIFNENPLNTNQKYKLPYNNQRPFIITNTGVVKPDKRGTLTNTDFNLIEMTPLCVGTLSKLKTDDGNYGGHYMNSYSFNPDQFQMKENNIGEVKLLAKNNLNNISYFNLFDMMGSSSTAYGIITDLLGISDVNPSYKLVDTEKNNVKSFDCIDGGVLDNTGILPMLQRQVKNIVLFVNTNNCINVSDNDEEMTKSIDIMLRQLFLGDEEVDKQYYFCYFEYICDLQVFEKERWKEFLNKMRHNIRENDIAYVELKKLKVLKNDNYHLSEYIIDKLQIIYLYETEDWKNNRLSKDVQEYMKKSEIKNFPYYNTIFENNGWIEKELIALTAPEVNLLSDLTYYNMMNNKIINEKFMKIFN